MDEDRPPDSPPPGFERHADVPSPGFEGPGGAPHPLPPAPGHVPPRPDLLGGRPPPMPALASDRPLPIREMRIGETLDAAIKLYRRYWKALMAMVAFVIVPYTFLQQYAVRDTGPRVRGGNLFVPNNTSDAAVIASVVFGVVSFLFVQPFLAAAISRAASRLYLGHDPEVGDTYRFALGLVHSILWVSFLTFLAVVGGFILFIVPGIIFAIRFTFGTTVVVVEGAKGRAAMRRSWALAKGQFWRIVATLFLAMLLAGIVGGFLAAPATIGSFFVGSEGWALRAVGTSIASVITTPFLALVRVLLYFDMRIRKEGFDLMVQAQELAVGRGRA
jgi:hypothetical protein